jgi:hypothetical protein
MPPRRPLALTAAALLTAATLAAGLGAVRAVSQPTPAAPPAKVAAAAPTVAQPVLDDGWGES